MKPVIHETAFVADNATVRGNVTIGEGAGIYFGAVLRAETDPITVGPGSNIQDNCVLHADPGFPTKVGRDCTVGHAAILHGCTIGDNTLVGMGAIVLNGAQRGQVHAVQQDHRAASFHCGGHPRRHPGPHLR